MKLYQTIYLTNKDNYPTIQTDDIHLHCVSKTGPLRLMRHSFGFLRHSVYNIIPSRGAVPFIQLAEKHLRAIASEHKIKVI